MQIVSSEQHSLTSDYQKLFGREVHETLDLQVNGQRTAEPLMSLQALKHMAASHTAKSDSCTPRSSCKYSGRVCPERC